MPIKFKEEDDSSGIEKKKKKRWIKDMAKLRTSLAVGAQEKGTWGNAAQRNKL